MRIAFIANPEAPGGWYRGVGPMVELSRRGHEIVQVWRPREGIRGDLIAGCELLHIYRAHDETVQRIARHAKQAGMALVYDNDDDLWAVPDKIAAARDYRGLSGARAQRQITRLLQMSDLAIATSEPIAERFRECGAAHVEVIENYVPDAALEASAPLNGDLVVAGWLAGTEHRFDVEQLPLREQIERALESCPRLVVETVGVRLGLRHERYRHVDHVHFFDLPAKLAEWDIGLAPIANAPFNRARSNIKVKEYAAVGRPWLASPVGPYRSLGEKQGGRLVADDGWCEALARLAEKPREQRKLAKRARKWGRAQAISANAGLWERALTGAVIRVGRTPRPAGPPRPVAIERTELRTRG